MHFCSLTVRKYSDMSKIRLAIVGCGAVARIHHLPAIALSDQVHAIVLVDQFLPHAHQLAEHYHIPVVADDYWEVIGQVDAAIVTLPNYLHAPVTTDLLENSIHVLVEKPMAIKTSECDNMIA